MPHKSLHNAISEAKPFDGVASFVGHQRDSFDGFAKGGG